MKTYQVTAQTGTNFTNENKTDSMTVTVQAHTMREAWQAGESEIRKNSRICIVHAVTKI